MTKFHDSKLKGCWDMVTQVIPKIRFLEFDLDLWPMTLTSNLSLDRVKVDPCTRNQGHRSNSSWFMNYCPVWFFVQWQTDGRTDRKWCIRAHRAWAQVGSKIMDSAQKWMFMDKGGWKPLRRISIWECSASFWLRPPVQNYANQIDVPVLNDSSQMDHHGIIWLL